MGRGHNIDADTLRDLYLRQRLSTTQIGKALDVSAPTVGTLLRKHGIPARSISEAKTDVRPPASRLAHIDAIMLSILVGKAIANGFTAATAERFLSKVEVAESSACWRWTGSGRRRGYGRFDLTGHAPGAHRVSCAMFNGPFAVVLDVLHDCDNPPCVNPKHLRPGTAVENAADMMARDRGPTGDRSGHVTHPERTPFGSRQGSAKITEDDALAIRVRNANGESTVALAKEFGLASSTVTQIVTGRTWNHVGGPRRRTIPPTQSRAGKAAWRAA